MNEHLLLWGGLELPARLATNHFLVAGTTGSGKTVTINLLLRSILPTLGPGTGKRLFVYDAKGELYWTLRALIAQHRPDLSVRFINPFVPNTHAWDIARDLTRPEDLDAVAKLLFPVTPGAKQPFFEEAAAALFKGVVISLRAVAGNDWTLRDALLALRSPLTLKQVLRLAADQNEHRLELYFPHGDVNRDVLSTVANRIESFEVLASYWKDRPRVTIEDWMRGDFVLVLGHSHRSPESVRAMNRAIFHRIAQLLLDEPDSETRRSWLFLDEASRAGRLDGLNDVLAKGRSRGVAAVLGFQDIAGFQDPKAYGEHETEEMMNQIGNKAILRVTGKMADWAQLQFGGAEVLRRTYSESWSSSAQGGSYTEGYSEHQVMKFIVLADEFRALKPLEEAHGLPGYYLTAGIGGYSYMIPEKLIREIPKAPPEGERPQLPISAVLSPWSDAERTRFGLPSARPRRQHPDSGDEPPEETLEYRELQP